jgi:hypothetical protein
MSRQLKHIVTIVLAPPQIIGQAPRVALPNRILCAQMDRLYLNAISGIMSFKIDPKVSYPLASLLRLRSIFLAPRGGI